MSNARNISDIFSKSTAISTDAEVSTAVVTERTTVATLSGKTILNPAMTNIIITPSSTTSTPITINGIASQSADYLNINTLVTGGTNLIKIDVNGNVGIGKTPSNKLDVNGVVNATGFTIGGVAITTPAATPSTLGTLVGYSALSNSTVSLGWQANYLTAGSYNTAIGPSALLGVTGSSNTALGYGAGSGVSSGAYNTLIGHNAGSGTATFLTTGSNNIVIGYNAATSSQTVSNEITIGDSNIASLRIPGLGIVGTGGNLGLGKTPSVKLDVNGTINATSVTINGAALVVDSLPQIFMLLGV